MTPTQRRHKFWHWLQAITLALCLSALLSARASGPSFVDHAFGFDVRVDSPDSLILNYRYGTSGMTFTSGDESIRYFGASNQAGNINGPQLLGDTLNVKWQEKVIGQTYEDTVNLKRIIRAGLLEIKAPTDGVVKDLGVTTSRAVMQPGRC